MSQTFVRISLAVATWCFSLPILYCTAGERPYQYAEIGFRSMAPKYTKYDLANFRTTCEGGSVKNELGHWVIHGVQGLPVYMPKDKKLVAVRYSLAPDEIVPVAGYMYRVVRTVNRIPINDSDDGIFAELDTILDKSLPKEVNPIKPDSFVVPLRRYSYEKTTVYSRDWIAVTGITVDKQGKAKAELLMGLHNQKPDRRATIQVGDILLIGPSGCEVRGIVPADSKLKTAGWVEFAPSYIPEADLVRQKKEFIRPIESKD